MSLKYKNRVKQKKKKNQLQGICLLSMKVNTSK